MHGQVDQTTKAVDAFLKISIARPNIDVVYAVKIKSSHRDEDQTKQIKIGVF